MLRGSIRLGRVAGIEIRAHWSLLATLGLLSWLLAGAILPARISGPSPAQFWIAGVAAAVGLLVSLLAHELAHSVVAGRYGVGVDGITLWLLGGVSELRDEPRTRKPICVSRWPDRSRASGSASSRWRRPRSSARPSRSW